MTSSNEVEVWFRDRTVPDNPSMLAMMLERIGREESWEARVTQYLIERVHRGAFEVRPNASRGGYDVVFAL